MSKYLTPFSFLLAAAAGGAAPAEAEAKKEEEPEEEVDMGGLFGGDDDYWKYSLKSTVAVDVVYLHQAESDYSSCCKGWEV